MRQVTRERDEDGIHDDVYEKEWMDDKIEK